MATIEKSAAARVRFDMMNSLAVSATHSASHEPL